MLSREPIVVGLPILTILKCQDGWELAQRPE
jgi:hypothetical protein